MQCSIDPSQQMPSADSQVLSTRPKSSPGNTTVSVTWICFTSCGLEGLSVHKCRERAIWIIMESTHLCPALLRQVAAEHPEKDYQLKEQLLCRSCGAPKPWWCSLHPTIAPPSTTCAHYIHLVIIITGLPHLHLAKLNLTAFLEYTDFSLSCPF